MGHAWGEARMRGEPGREGRSGWEKGDQLYVHLMDCTRDVLFAEFKRNSTRSTWERYRRWLWNEQPC